MGLNVSPKNVPNSEKTHIEESAEGVTITGAKFNTPEPGKEDWAHVFERFGLSADHFELVGDSVRMSSWDSSKRTEDGDRDIVQLYSFRATFKRKAFTDDRDISAIIAKIEATDFTTPTPERPEAFIHAVGDLQLGKVDGDGTEGIVARFYASVAAAAERIKAAGGYKHVHAAWLGDCLEGFVSQNGKNAWRTTLTLTEQIDLLENLMLHQIKTFAPLCERLTVVSVPGNHDEAGRQFSTRADDSHAVQALRSVTKALRMSPKFAHVQTFLPERDEMTVTVEVAGSLIAHAHGHSWSRGKHWDWWSGQTFGGHLAGEARILLCGHEHHHTVDTRSKRTFIRVPAFESESTWWRHKTGQVGDPGGLYMTTRDNKVKEITVI